MIPTSADILGIDTPKDLPSYREIIMPSIVTTSRWTIDCAWIRMRRNVSHLGSHYLNGPKWRMRLGPCDDAIMFGPWAQWGRARTSKICKCSTMNPPVSKKDSIFSWFSYWSWTQNKAGRWHFSKMFFIYIILYIYIYIYIFKEFFKDILESNRNYEIEKLKVT